MLTVFVVLAGGFVLPAVADASTSTDSLVGYWKFDETSAGTFVDSSGEGKTGTGTGSSGDNDTPQPNTDVDSGFSFTNGRSLEFDGTDDYVSLPDLSSYFDDEGTIAAWIKIDADPPPSGSETGIWRFGTGGSRPHYPWTDGSLYLDAFRNDRVNMGDNSAFDKSKWHHLAITNKPGANNYIVYQNGSVFATTTGENTVTIATSPEIGRSDSGHRLDGRIDDVRLYNVALSADAISDLAAGDHPTATWDGSSDTDWDTVGNWDTNAVPDLYTNVVVPDVANDPILASAVEVINLTITGVLDLNGFDLSQNDSGTFSNTGTLKLQGDESFTSVTNDSDSGTVEYDGTGTYTSLPAGGAYNNLTFSGSGSWDADADVTVAGALSISGGEYDANTQTTTVTGLCTVSGGTYVTNSGTQTFNGGLTVSGGTVTGSTGTVDVNGDLTVSSGTLTAPGASGSLTVSGDFAHSGGTFTHNSGTVTLDGTDQTLSGTSTFNNLTKTVAAAATLTFPASVTTTVAGTWTVDGASGNLLSLRSSSNGTQWTIDPQGTRTIEYLDVKDSNNTNATKVATAGFNITDSGNNDGWSFNPEAPTSFSGSAASSTSITWTWTDNATDETGFKLYDSDTSTLLATIATANTASYTETGLTRGTTYRRYVAAYNGAGNSDASNGKEVTTSTSKPAVFSLLSPGEGGEVTSGLPTFSFYKAIDDDDGISKYTLYVDDDIALTIPKDGTTGNPFTGEAFFSSYSGENDGFTSNDVVFVTLTGGINSLPLADGSHTWYVKATDNSGNTRTTLSRSFTVNTTPAVDETVKEPDTESAESGETEEATSNVLTNAGEKIAETLKEVAQEIQFDELEEAATKRRGKEAENLTDFARSLRDSDLAERFGQSTRALGNVLNRTASGLAQIFNTIGDGSRRLVASAAGLLNQSVAVIDGIAVKGAASRDAVGESVQHLSVNVRNSFVDEKKGVPEHLKDHVYDEVKIALADGDGNPLAGAQLTLFSEAKESVTDEEGIALFREVETGQHRLKISYAGKTTTERLLLNQDVSSVFVGVNASFGISVVWTISLVASALVIGWGLGMHRVGKW